MNLGQHFLGRNWCSLDFATGCTQLGVWGQSVQLVGRLASRPQWAKEGRQPGCTWTHSPPPSATGLGAPRKGGELCPLEAMLLGTGEPESWFMDWAPTVAAWALPPPHGEELGAELGSLEETGAAFTKPCLAASSLGSWADECERADAALAVAIAQMGRGYPDESPGDDTATTEDQLEEEEDWEWLTVLETATAPLPPRPAGTGEPAPRAGRRLLNPPKGQPAKGTQRSLGSVPGKGVVNPKVGGAAIQGPMPEGSLAAPAACGGQKKTRSRC